MVRCKDCYYWSWDSRGDDEFECCLYWFMTRTDVYPAHNDDNPLDEYEEWDCSYFITEEEHEELEEKESETMTKLPFCLQPSKPSDNNDYESYKKGEFELEEWEDVNYCEHSFSYGDNGLTDREVVDLLNDLYEKNQQYEILVKSLKEQNQKLKLRLKDLGVEYF